MKRKRVILISVCVLVVLAIPGYLRVFRVLGDSDAPALVTGDRVLVSFLAYDIRLPYFRRPAIRFRDPHPGDIVMFINDRDQIVFKRVVAGPGARISMERNHLIIDDRALIYENDESAPRRGELGDVLERELGNGWDINISYTPGAESIREFDELVVPQNSYFVLGSNRDCSEDSRHHGPVERDRIIGKVLRKL